MNENNYLDYITQSDADYITCEICGEYTHLSAKDFGDGTGVCTECHLEEEADLSV